MTYEDALKFLSKYGFQSSPPTPEELAEERPTDRQLADCRSVAVLWNYQDGNLVDLAIHAVKSYWESQGEPQ